MNGWNSKQVRDMYPAQAMGTLTKQENGRINVERPDVAAEMRKLVATQGADPDAHATRQEARKIAVSQRQAGFPFTRPTFGYAAMWAAEVGAPEDLDGLLKHAHRYLNPCWSKGGLYYPRNDTWEDSEGNWRFVDPFTGNGAIGYARLNVPDGQKKLWEQAWSSETVQKKVAAEGVSFANGADFLRCEWVSEAGAGFTSLVITMRTWHGQKTSICPRVVNLPAGRYGVYIDGVLTRYCEQDKGLAMELEVEVGGDEMTIGVLQE